MKLPLQYLLLLLSSVPHFHQQHGCLAFLPTHQRRQHFVRVFPSISTSPLQSRSTFSLSLSTDPLASEGDWTAFLDDEGTGLVYYFNTKTGESLWEPPTETFPEIELTGKMRRLAKSKREEYLKAVEEEEAKERSLFADFLDDNEQVTAQTVSKKGKDDKKEQEDWFNFLFEEKEAIEEEKPGFSFFEQQGIAKIERAEPVVEPTRMEEKPETMERVEEKPKKEEKNWFDFLFEERKAAQPVEPPTSEVVPEERKEGFFDRFWKPPEIKIEGFEMPQVKPQPVKKVKERKEVAPKKVAEKVVVPVEKPIKIVAGYNVMPHPEKIRWGGEDAVFVKGKTFGVFDGVSGAEKLDGIPLYSRVLAEEVQSRISDNGMTIPELTRCLSEAAEVADNCATGASTAIVASITDDGYLRALNVGDSTCIVIRDGKIVGKSREINHYFECPYQLSDDSPDRPRDGTKLTVELKRGDTIVMGSDGVFDNLTPEEIIEIVTNGPKVPSAIAKRINDRSRKVSFNQNAATPYAKAAQRFKDPQYLDGLGGKVDDISCVVVRYE